jgi:hypothetical protein
VEGESNTKRDRTKGVKATIIPHTHNTLQHSLGPVLLSHWCAPHSTSSPSDLDIRPKGVHLTGGWSTSSISSSPGARVPKMLEPKWEEDLSQQDPAVLLMKFSE